MTPVGVRRQENTVGPDRGVESGLQYGTIGPVRHRIYGTKEKTT